MPRGVPGRLTYRSSQKTRTINGGKVITVLDLAHRMGKEFIEKPAIAFYLGYSTDRSDGVAETLDEMEGNQLIVREGNVIRLSQMSVTVRNIQPPTFEGKLQLFREDNLTSANRQAIPVNYMAETNNWNVKFPRQIFTFLVAPNVGVFVLFKSQRTMCFHKEHLEAMASLHPQGRLIPLEKNLVVIVTAGPIAVHRAQHYHALTGSFTGWEAPPI